MSSEQAKINKKLATRFIIGVVVLGALVGAYFFFSQWSKDPVGAATFSSAGYIVAVEELDRGSQVVVFDPAGKKIPSPDYKEGSRDRNPVWSPDGNHVFFISDRETGEPHVFRWSLGAEKVERRSLDRRGRTGMSFASPGLETKTGLLTTGAAVLEYDPSTMQARSVLPPGKGGQTTRSGDEGGTVNMFEIMYRPLGNNFIKALWGAEKKSAIATIRREDGEVVFIQKLGEVAQPKPFLAGESIDFDVNPSNGKVVLAIRHLQLISTDPAKIPPDYIKNKRVVLPFRHGLVIYDPANDGVEPLILTKGKAPAFKEPAFSPDGSKVVAVAGEEVEGGVQPNVLAVMPAVAAGGSQAVPLVQGKVASPRWHPSGSSVVYVKQGADGKLGIYTVDASGGAEKPISTAGSYTQPAFSPQAAAS